VASILEQEEDGLALEEVSQDSFLEQEDSTQVEEFHPRVSTQEEEEEEHLPQVFLPPAQGLEQSQ